MLSTFTAFFDSNVFFGARLRSLILFLAQTGHFRARWSEDVHREWMMAVLAKRIDLTEEIVSRWARQMDSAVLNCKVTDYEPLIPALTLPDPDDRHILAAAIKASASCIVTFNQKDFPEKVLETYGLHTRHPDKFILDLESLDGPALIAQVQKDWKHYCNPPLTFSAYLDGLRASGVLKSADFLASVGILFGEPPQGG